MVVLNKDGVYYNNKRINIFNPIPLLYLNNSGLIINLSDDIFDNEDDVILYKLSKIDGNKIDAIFEAFNSRLKNLFNDIMVEYSGEFITIINKYCSLYKEEKTITTLSNKNKDEYFGWEVLRLNDVDKYTWAIIGEDQYEAEFLENYLKEQNVLVKNNVPNNNILKYYIDFFNSKYKNYDYKFQKINIDNFYTYLNEFTKTDIKIYDINFIKKQINDKTSFLSSKEYINSLNEETYYPVLFNYLNNILNSIDNINKDDFIFYTNNFLQTIDIIYDDNSFKIYLNFLNILKKAVNKFTNKRSDIIDAYKFDMIKNYLPLIKEDEMYKYCFGEINKFETKYDINPILEDLGININCWIGSFMAKNYTNTDNQIKIMGEIRKSLNGEMVDLSPRNINENIVSLSFFAYQVVRIMSYNKWKHNNLIIEDLISAIDSYKNNIIENSKILNLMSINRLTTLISTTNNIKLRYNIDNNRYDINKLLSNYYNDIMFIYNSKLINTHTGTTKKLIEDIIKLQMWYNYYNINISLKEAYDNISKRLNKIMLFFDNNYFIKYENNEYISLWEQAYIILGSVMFTYKDILNINTKNVNSGNLAYLPIKHFKEYIELFNTAYINSIEYNIEEFNTSINYNFIYN